MRVLDRILAMEEINNGGRCPTYMYRWRLLRLPWVQVYLHHFVKDDWSKDRHDHPKRFISIGLSGCYIEETPQGERTYRAPWVRTFPATHIHRLRLIDQKPCWTVVIVLKVVREWGFWSEGRWVRWDRYVHSSLAAKSKHCP